MPKSIVYTLALEGGRYYVGGTRNPIEERIQAHALQQGWGSQWTERWKVTGLHSIIEVEGLNYLPTERAQTALMMTLHGWQNVRGGPWVKVDMRNPPTFWDPESKALALKYPKKHIPPSPSSPRDAAPNVVPEEEASPGKQLECKEGEVPPRKA